MTGEMDIAPKCDEVVQGKFHIYVGCSSYGTFKGVELRKSPQEPECKNLFPISNIDKTRKVITMNWRDSSQRHILQALENTDVHIFSTDTNKVIQNISTLKGKGSIRGIAEYKDKILTAYESGLVVAWNNNDEKDNAESFHFDTGKLLNVMRYCDDTIATGGYENDLSMWDLQSHKRIFRAKNVRPDFLQLRVPVSVCDIQYMVQSPRIVSCHKIGFVRIYDPKSQRRPVINWSVPEESFTCIALTHSETGIVAGSNKGGMYLFDVRNTKKFVSRFKGFTGCVTAVACHKTEPYIVSTSLDKHVRVHSLNTTALLHKVYVVSPGDSVLVRSNYSFDRLLKTASSKDSGASDESCDDEVSEKSEDNDEDNIVKSEDQVNDGLDWSDDTDDENDEATVKDEIECIPEEKICESDCEPPKKKRKKTRK